MKSKIILILCCSLTIICFSCRKEVKSPNIIYILADDLGYSQLGCYGQEKIKTPNIDALASSGMLFTQHYSGAPVCAPSRCVLLTGKHLGHAQIRGNDEWTERGDVWDYAKTTENPYLEGQFPIDKGTLTIGKLLQNAGYKTGVVGKWGLGGPLTEGAPNKQGFDFFFGYNCQRQAHTYYPKHLWKDTTKVWLDNKLVVPGTKLPEDADPYDEASYSDYSLNQYSPQLMQEEVLRFIKENKDRPFFMYYASIIPHTALQVPKEWTEYYRNKFGDEEPYLGKKGYFPARYPHATFAGMISYLDEQVGEIITTLKELGLYENTLIIFSSDNGPAFMGGTDSPWFDSAKPYKSDRGWGKCYLTEGGIHIPMIAAWPGQIKAGKKSDHISAFYDVLPTFCDIAGIKTPGNIDGISFLPTLVGEKNQQQHEYLYWEYPASEGQQAVRLGKWKGIRRHIFKDSMHIHLYNLGNDIQELHDVSSENPEVVKKIEQIFEDAHIKSENEQFCIKQLGD